MLIIICKLKQQKKYTMTKNRKIIDCELEFYALNLFMMKNKRIDEMIFYNFFTLPPTLTINPLFPSSNLRLSYNKKSPQKRTFFVMVARGRFELSTHGL